MCRTLRPKILQTKSMLTLVRHDLLNNIITSDEITTAYLTTAMKPEIQSAGKPILNLHKPAHPLPPSALVASLSLTHFYPLTITPPYNHHLRRRPQVYGDKDADGFYWGECRGRRGYVPHNMVEEVKDPNEIAQLQAAQGGPGVGGPSRRSQVPNDRWGDIYASMPVRKMIALYDYDPHELSPNVDAEVGGRGVNCRKRGGMAWRQRLTVARSIRRSGS